jgi:hypothetical protein
MHSLALLRGAIWPPSAGTDLRPHFENGLVNGADPQHLFRRASNRGHSLMVKLQPSKLAMRVRFSLPAPFPPRELAAPTIRLRVPAVSANSARPPRQTCAFSP